MQEVFANIGAEGNPLVSIEPKPSYHSLFAAMLMQNPVRYDEANYNSFPLYGYLISMHISSFREIIMVQ